jgi:NADH:ubiquinone oxidoreductase subunit 6 (subunit J)
MGGMIWYLFAVMAGASAVVVAANKNVVHCGFALLFTLLGVGAMYAFLGADFLAATQMIVYVGGILVLVLFAVMMTHKVQAVRLREELIQPFAALGTALLVLALILLVVHRTAWPLAAGHEPAPTTAQIGREFLTTFLFPFEFASVLLLVAMMGAAMIIRDRKPREASPGDSAAEVPGGPAAGLPGGSAAGLPGGPATGLPGGASGQAQGGA